MKSHHTIRAKFTDWLRGTPKPVSATAEDWHAWEKTAKAKKIRYWLAEDGLDYLQNFICWPARRIQDVRGYINNRWILKSHALTSHLPRGEWHEFDTRLLHAVFDELVNFVEIEQAWMLVMCSEDDRKKYKVPWYRSIFRIGAWRCPEAGLAYLDWAAGLKKDEDWCDKNAPDFGQPTAQALAAQEVQALYKWWKEERPKRPDPSDTSGWSDYCEEMQNTANIVKEEEKKRSRSILDVYYKIERAQEEEDTAMLIRLVKIRQCLWT